MRILLDTNYYHESHYAVLPTQSTVYGLTELASKTDKNRMLVTSRMGRVLSLEFSDHKDRNGKYTDVKPITKDVQFTFPGKSEVISIDAFYTDHYIVGITLIKPKVKELDQEQFQYLNIYKDYKPGYEYDLSNINQYEMLELDFIPYILTHAELYLENKKDTIFLLSGGDSKMHIYSQVKQDDKMCFADQTEVYCKHFPEFCKYESCLTCISIRYDHAKYQRIVAYGLTSGSITLTVVDYRKSEILMQTTASHDSPINKLSLFHKDNRSNTMHLVVASSIQPTVVYHDVLRMGLRDNCLMLPGSHLYDCILSVYVVDVDFDGVPEIMIGTYGQELIIYKYYDYLIPEYKMIWQRGFSDPILSLHSTDITGDGLKEVIVLTLRGVHVLQHDLEIVKVTLATRLKEKAFKQQMQTKTMKMFKIGSY